MNTSLIQFSDNIRKEWIAFSGIRNCSVSDSALWLKENILLYYSFVQQMQNGKEH